MFSHRIIAASFPIGTLIIFELLKGAIALDCYECRVYEQQLSIQGEGNPCLSPVSGNLTARDCPVTNPACYKYVYYSTQIRIIPNSTDPPEVLKGWWMQRGCVSKTTDPDFPNLPDPKGCKAYPKIILNGSSEHTDPEATNDVQDNRYICTCSEDGCNEDEGFNITRPGSGSSDAMRLLVHSVSTVLVVMLFAGLLACVVTINFESLVYDHSPHTQRRIRL